MESNHVGTLRTMPTLMPGRWRPALVSGPLAVDRVPTMSEPVDPSAVRAVEMLSRRELEVLQELVDGKSHDAAAADLFISHHTFRTHVKNILTKFGAHSSIEAVSIAVCAGMRPTRMTRSKPAEFDGGVSGDGMRPLD